jgi:UDP-N-acetylmuramate dehydrogenase
MLTINRDYSLKHLNTFGIDVKAKFFLEVSTVETLKEAIAEANKLTENILILGGGSNILFTTDFDGAIIHPAIEGIEKISETETHIVLKVGAGVDWDYFVNHTVTQGLGGIENLSLIPGSVGASPIQNIGAYGVEVKDTILKVEGIFIDSLKGFMFSNADCNFGYRDSVFKNDLKRKVIVTHVYFSLSKQPTLVTHYGNLDTEIEKFGERNLKNVRQAVINIRESKLPDPKVLGNAGSFFKNPIVEILLVEELQKNFEKVPFYPVNESFVKLPAGWLIEQSGWKGKRIGNVGVHKDQALVIVNYGGATGNEVVELAHMVRQAVMKQFNVSLEMEVNMV